MARPAMVDQPSARAVRFGEFVLDVSAYELRRNDRPVRLERLAMDLLLLLVERRGELVTRSQMLEKLWGAEVFVDVDASVNTLIRKIRRALRDSVDDPRFIQTVQGKGYRFIAAVDAVPPYVDRAEPGPSRDLAVADITPPRVSSPLREPRGLLEYWRPARKRPAVATASVIFVVGAFLAWRLYAPGAVLPVRVAVMPFENLSGDAGRDYLTEGFTDEAAASLGQIVDPQRVIVLGRMATRPYKGGHKSPAEIGRELGVDYLVFGSVRAENSHLRVTSSLIRVRGQVQVWSESWEHNREPQRMLDIQQELGTVVARQVRQRLAPERLHGLAQRQTRNPDAYDHYLRGRSFWNQLTPASTRRAMELYQQATALDPRYAVAWAGIADAWTTGPIHSDIPPLDVRDRARVAAQTAILYGDMLAEAHTSEAVRQFFLEWNWQLSEARFQRAVEINPNYAMAHRNFGVLLSHSGRHEAARSELALARELDREYVMNHALSAMVEFHAGNMDAAVGHARRGIAVDPTFWITHFHFAQVYEQMGQTDRALDELASAAPRSNGNSKIPSLRGYVLAKAGRAAEARDVLATFERTSATRYVPPYARALVYAGLGERDLTFDWLDKAFAARDVHLIFLPVDPKWRPYRSDPRFQDLLRRCGFSGDAEAAEGAPAR
jgi:DNA-binding winged helix-turn-helix (wHTH) protein/TolB-like protein/tetratricopeptide (TPR) repeat protein